MLYPNGLIFPQICSYHKGALHIQLYVPSFCLCTFFMLLGSMMRLICFCFDRKTRFLFRLMSTHVKCSCKTKFYVIDIIAWLFSGNFFTIISTIYQVMSLTFITHVICCFLTLLICLFLLMAH